MKNFFYNKRALVEYIKLRTYREHDLNVLCKKFKQVYATTYITLKFKITKFITSFITEIEDNKEHDYKRTNMMYIT